MQLQKASPSLKSFLTIIYTVLKTSLGDVFCFNASLALQGHIHVFSLTSNRTHNCYKESFSKYQLYTSFKFNVKCKIVCNCL